MVVWCRYGNREGHVHARPRHDRSAARHRGATGPAEEPRRARRDPRFQRPRRALERARASSAPRDLRSAGGRGPRPSPARRGEGAGRAAAGATGGRASRAPPPAVIVLDTSVLIDALAGPRRSAPAMRRAIESGERLVVPSLVLYEWLRGPRLENEL